MLIVISEGLTQVIEFQGYIKAEITTLSGIVFFIGEFLVILFVTSFKKYQESRNFIICLLGIEIVI